ncbi:large subunit ribosomal protein LP2 [Nematocida homosporus]|uniref:large subunit ribosomal protein LP2 n=1 Tax=Nematocida homosporus TaxID=1912981 RepID=UPI0022200325|nr:large subunit ribosomal protein LP2 [Nematocida homosporus]KAI5186346.1 large subunit ribosomal protein LP2 [Nematocida homosporus]
MNCLVPYRLLHLVNGKAPSAAEIEALLKTIGASVDTDKIKALMEKVEGKSPEELIQQGMSKVAVAAAPSASASTTTTATTAVQEESEESESSGEMDLFG